MHSCSLLVLKMLVSVDNKIDNRRSCNTMTLFALELVDSVSIQHFMI